MLQACVLRGLALQQCDLLGVLAHAHEVEAEVRFVALLQEIEIDQRLADPVCQRGADDGVDQRGPDQIAGYRDFIAEHDQRSVGRKAPQDDDKGNELHAGAEHPQTDGRSPFSENSLMSSAMRWSGLSAASPRSCIR